MLKFNVKNHKIEELKSYGFAKDIGYMRVFNRDGFIIENCISVGNNNRIIIDIQDNNNKQDLIECLYYLIKDGLIIKE